MGLDFGFSLSGISFYRNENFVSETWQGFADPHTMHVSDTMITLTDEGSVFIITCRLIVKIKQSARKRESCIYEAEGGPLSLWLPARAAGIMSSDEAHLILFSHKGKKLSRLSELCWTAINESGKLTEGGEALPASFSKSPSFLLIDECVKQAGISTLPHIRFSWKLMRLPR